ncbi:MAG: N-acetylmuramoyl-L-alanine amidase [Gaiellaceae bacterium]
MRRLLFAALLFFVWAGAAHAAPPVRMVVRDVGTAPTRSLASATQRFNMVGLHWKGRGTPSFRVRGSHGWSAWQQADDDSGRSGAWRRSNAVWTGTATAIAIRKRGDVTRVREYLLWSPPIHEAGRALQITGSPTIVTRSGWHAEEEIRRGKPRYAPTLQFALVHHTVNSNAYSCNQSASLVRGIEVYHVRGNGWDDIGYNFLVDACGQVFEGRYGGIMKNVVGAHSQGFNSGSVGVAMIGNYGRATPSKAAQDALVKLLAWRLDVAHVDPAATVVYKSGGNSKFRAGTRVKLNDISAHRDTYLTECPGSALYSLLPSIRTRVAQTGLPKLYSPVISGAVGGFVRFGARLTSSLPWTITVAGPSGATVATGSGIGPDVFWTWDATFAPPAAYTWVISAGATVRAAVGVIGGTLPALTLTDARVNPPTLDGLAVPKATVSYTLSAGASVTAELVDSTGVTATLSTQTKAAGAQSFAFAAAGLAEGNYTIRLTARDLLGRTAQATAPVTISHSVLSFTADSRLVSPNSDGRHDQAVFKFTLAQPSDVTLSLSSALFSFPLLSAQLGIGVQSFAFTGLAANGVQVPDGPYAATLTVAGLTQSLPLVIDRVPPALAIASLKPLTVRVTEPVTLIATINGRIVKASVKPGLTKISPETVVSTLRLVARDAAGNESPPLTYPLR